MERKDFLKGLGIAGAGAMLPLSKTKSTNLQKESKHAFACTLIPAETAGPYPLSGTSIVVSDITRSDMTAGQTGVPLALTITLKNLSCTAISGARIEVWHCNRYGYYSGYSNAPGPNGSGGGTINYTGVNWLRGSQTTDSNGQVTFTSIYPGWYLPRATHIHAQVYIAGTLVYTSQLAFPDSINTTVNSFYGLTANGTVNSTDQVFSDGYALELMTVTGDTTSGYAATIDYAIDFTVTPLTLISFRAGTDNGFATLWWVTTNEINTSSFEIEKSTNGKDFFVTGTVTAQKKEGTNSYSFTDTIKLTGTTYYRLKMIDGDGAYKNSFIVVVKSKSAEQISIYPNPAKSTIVLSHPKADNNTYVEVLSFDGKQLAWIKLAVGATQTSMDVSLLARGIYLLSYVSISDKQAIKLIKN